MHVYLNETNRVRVCNAFTGASLDWVPPPSGWDDPIDVDHMVNNPPWDYYYIAPENKDLVIIDEKEVDLNNFTINTTGSTETDYDISTLCKQINGPRFNQIDRFCVLVYFTKLFKNEKEQQTFNEIYSIKATNKQYINFGTGLASR